MLGGVVILLGSVVCIRSSRECAGEAAERNGILVLRHRLVISQADVCVFLIRPPGLAGALQIVAQALSRRLVSTAGAKWIIVVECAQIRARQFRCSSARKGECQWPVFR